MPTKLLYTTSKSTLSIQKLLVIKEKGVKASTQLLDTLTQAYETQGTNDLTLLNKVIEQNPDKNHTHIINGAEGPISLTLASIDNKKGRNNAVIRADLIPDLIKKNIPDEVNAQISFVLEENQVFASACAVARAFHQYSRKASFLNSAERTIHINFYSPDGQAYDSLDLNELQAVSDNIRLAARLTDTPCSELNTVTYVSEVEELIRDIPSIKLEVIKGEELKERGFGGLWGVGKAAVHLPALAILTYEPTQSKPDQKAVALVGKGICYDTGGLSLKSTTAMPTMKVDMGGSAAVLGAVLSAAKTQLPHRIHGLLCLAENSCDQLSTRPDDILTLYSGKTVEVNNTDAEGRLVLGDGVAYASRHLNVEYIVDIATLTGAQLIATGPRHAGIMSNVAEFEPRVLHAAHTSGDLAHPLIYAPEFLLKDLESEVADLKNSNKNGPTTAASSLAGHFIEAHLHPNYKGVWCHIDIAGPATKGPRATGFGVALLYNLLKQLN